MVTKTNIKKQNLDLLEQVRQAWSKAQYECDPTRPSEDYIAHEECALCKEYHQSYASKNLRGDWTCRKNCPFVTLTGEDGGCQQVASRLAFSLSPNGSSIDLSFEYASFNEKASLPEMEEFTAAVVEFLKEMKEALKNDTLPTLQW